MVRIKLLLQSTVNRLSAKSRKAVAILSLAAIVAANLQFEVQKFTAPDRAMAQTATQCSDGIDNDGDGLFDMQDPGCTDPSDDSEFNVPTAATPTPSAPAPTQCNDGVDNDGDGLVDMQDPGCTDPSDNNEFNAPVAPASSAAAVTQCSDGIDNDGDGLVDMQDPGCTDPSDNNEYNAPVVSSAASSTTTILPQCSDGVDNDGDGLVDYPNDPGCTSPSDNDEYNAPVVSSAASSTTTILPQCSDGVDNDGDGKVDYPQDPGCTSPSDNDEYNAPVVSSAASSIVTILPQCSDGVDNDGDGKVDALDPGCHTDGNVNNAASYNPNDNDEYNAPVSSAASSTTTILPQCSDGVDNDGDGKVDYPQDPGCTSPSDNDEFNLPITSSASSISPILPQCSDGVDNDGDGLVDYPNDPGCTSPTDNDEFNLPTSSSMSSAHVYQCSDGVDNDGDGLVDYPNDPGCTSPTDNDEFNLPLSSSSIPSSVASSSAPSSIASSSASSINGTTDLSIQKNGPASVLRGNNALYTLSVTNSGPAVAQNVIVTDAFPTGFIFNASGSDGRCALDNGQVRCQLGTMAPGTQSLALNFTVPQVTPCTNGNVYNTAIVSSATTDPNLSNNTSNTVVTTVICPSVSSSSAQSSSLSSSSASSTPGTNDLSIQKSGPASIVRGNSAVYTITVTNAGPNNAQNVIVTDAFPAGFIFDPSASDGRCTLDNGQVRCQLGSLAVGTQSLTLSFIVPLTNLCSNMDVYNTAIVSSSSLDPNLNNNTSNTVVTTVQCPASSSSSSMSSSSTSSTQSSSISSMSSSSSSSSIPATGCINILKQTYSPEGYPYSMIAPFIFNLDGTMMSTVNDNSGHAKFSNIPVGVHNISEVVPAGWTQQSVYPQNGLVTVFGSSDNSACASIVFQNKLNATSSSSSMSSASSTSSTPSTYADLSITKTASPSTVALGSQTVFTVVVYNNSNISAQNVIVNDPLPSGLNYVSSVTTSGNYSGSQWNIGTLIANGSATLQMTATMNVNGSVTNTATVTATTPDSNPGNNTASATVYGTDQSGCIEIYKTATDYNGNQIYSVPSFTFSLDGNRTVSNDSYGHARFDNVPAGQHSISEYGESDWRMDSMTPNNGSVTVGSNNGTCATVYVRNRQVGNNNGNDSFTISKTDDRSTVHPGDRLTYTITVRNNDGFSKNNVMVRDILPNYLTAQTASDNGHINGNTVSWDDLYMASYSTRTFTVNVTVDNNATGTITNRAEVNGRVAYDTDVVDENGTSNGTLELTKDASTSEVFPGGMIEYTVRVHNNSDTTMSNVRVMDNLPANVTVIDDGNADTGGNSRLQWNIGSLSPNASRVIRYRLSIGNSYTVGRFVRNDAEATANNNLDEHASSIVQVIGNLPQTGFMSADLLGGNIALHPITGSGSSSTLPLLFWLALAGLTTGSGAGFLRKFVTGGI